MKKRFAAFLIVVMLVALFAFSSCTKQEPSITTVTEEEWKDILSGKRIADNFTREIDMSINEKDEIKKIITKVDFSNHKMYNKGYFNGNSEPSESFFHIENGQLFQYGKSNQDITKWIRSLCDIPNSSIRAEDYFLELYNIYYNTVVEVFVERYNEFEYNDENKEYVAENINIYTEFEIVEEIKKAVLKFENGNIIFIYIDFNIVHVPSGRKDNCIATIKFTDYGSTKITLPSQFEEESTTDR